MGKIKRKAVQVLWFLLLFILGPSDPSHSQERVFTNSMGMEFVLLPAGGFDMGSRPAEKLRDPGETLHPVNLTKAFYMQTSEVTVGQWTSVMGRRFLGARSGPSGSPVTRVSWFDCAEFIKKLNERGEGVYRLPTEAEWEYACRAGSGSPFSWGTEIDCTRAMFANHTQKEDECTKVSQSKGMQVDGPALVKSYPPNAWGLYDMHGNVWEWCQDWFGEYPQSQVTDPTGPESGSLKVRRGGSWFSAGHRLRCANRAYAHPASRFRNTGLRLVREVP